METRPELVSELRSMAHEGVLPSQMLRLLISHLADQAIQGMVDRVLLVQHFNEAFYFDDGEAYPIFGWAPDGSGELQDERIDYLLSKRIEKTKPAWDASPTQAKTSI
jgi:hypothetical protein